MTVLLHVALVLALCGDWRVAVLFFAASWVLVRGRSLLPERLRPAWALLGLAALAALLLFVRKSPLLAGWAADPPAALARLFDSRLWWGARFLGASYCFLRVVYALFDARRWTFAAYLRYFFFFPTFFSGPVMQPGELLDAQARPGRTAAAEGAARILSGLLRIAAACIILELVPLGSSQQLHWALARQSSPALWAGVFGSGLWLYLNFSGFSDVFIGLSLFLGVRAPENFDAPYAAIDLTDFWRRWHMSLGRWLRATTFAPLGRGVLKLSPRAAMLAGLVAPIAAMLVCGAWHRLEAAFLVWGLLHGLGLAVHALWSKLAPALLAGRVRASGGYRAGAWILTHAYVTLTWVFFLPVRGVDLDTRVHLLRSMFGG